MIPIADVVLYHGPGCSDGWASAWLAHRYGGVPAENLIPVSYGQPPPDLTGQRVLIVDFSYKRSVMLDIVRQAASVVVLDHHESAEKELEGLAIECLKMGLKPPHIGFDMTHSGAMLMWRWLSYAPPPAIVTYVEDRDLWKWKLFESKAINAAIRSYPIDLKVWDRLNAEIGDKGGFPRLVNEGKAILRYQDEVVAQHVGHAVETTIAGHKVLAVNATVLFSEIAGELARGRPFGAAFFIRKDGKRVYSLRSDENGQNVSLIAAVFGGGGHMRSAGFETDQEYHFADQKV